MAYDAFTIDTNIAVRNGLQLDSGLLAQLQQFKAGPLQFVLTEIVARELLKHLGTQVTDASESLRVALDKASKAQLTGASMADLIVKFDGLPEPNVIARERLKLFIQSTGATLILAKFASIDSLLTGYFGSQAPFDTSGSKKHEFPDAIALQSLEAWAKGHTKRILAVSNDKGWKAFAENSEHIDVLEDLAGALQLVQLHTDKAERAVQLWLAALNGSSVEPFAEVLREALSEIQFDVDGHGHNCRAGDSEDLQLISYDIIQLNGVPDLAVVRLGSNEIAATVGLNIVANAFATFSMAAWDGIDKEDMDMGYQSAEKEIEFEGRVLITFLAEEEIVPTPLKLIGLEVIEGPGTVDFGEIEIDFGDDDFDDWIAERESVEDASDEPMAEQRLPI